MTVRDFYKYCEENNLLDYEMTTLDSDSCENVNLEFGYNIVTFSDDKVMSISDFWDV